MQDVNRAREVFRNAAAACETDASSIRYAQPKEKELVDFLVGELQFDQQNAATKVEKYIKARRAVKQTTLAGFIKKLK